MKIIQRTQNTQSTINLKIIFVIICLLFSGLDKAGLSAAPAETLNENSTQKKRFEVFFPEKWEYLYVSGISQKKIPDRDDAWKDYKPYTLPKNPDNSRFLWVKTTLPGHILRDANLLYIRYLQNISQIWLGEEILVDGAQNISSSYFPLKNYSEPVELSILLELSLGNSFVIQELWVGSYISTIFYRISRDIDRIFFGIFFALVGIAAFFLGQKNNQRKMMYAFSVFTLVAGIYVFMDTPTINMFFAAEDIAPLLITISCLVFFSVSLFKFLLETFPALQPFWFKYLFYVLLISAIFIIMLISFNRWSFENFEYILQIYLVPAALIEVMQTIFIIRHAFSGNKKIKYFTIGLLFLMAAVIHDTLVALQILDYFTLLLHWGIFAFILFLIQIIKMTWKEQSEEIINYNKNLEHMVVDRTRKLESAQKQIVVQEKMAALGNMTAGIAHELKNPLNFINNFSELSGDLINDLEDARNEKKSDLEVQRVSDLLRSNLNKIHDHGKRANDIINSMLLHSHRGSANKQITDINKILKDSLQLAYHGMRATIQNFDIQIKEDYGKLDQISIVPQDIARVFVNIINNGIYATIEKKSQQPDYQPVLKISSREINLEGNTRTIEVRIRDNGTGIEESIKGKLFEPFFTTKPPGSNTGLGLSISYDLVVKGHDGQIEVDSVLGEYAEFIIRLPVR